MATIILRQANVVTTPGGVVKGSPLTNSEVDNNFANVNVELSDLGNTVAGLSTFEISNANTRLSITVADGPLNLTGNIIPTSDNVFSLGSPSNVFADLFLSGNSLHLGNIVLSVINGNVALDGVEVLSSTGGATPADGSITTAKLSTTGVTAATYGNATLIPTFTVGVDGRITTAGNVIIVGGATLEDNTTANVSVFPTMATSNTGSFTTAVVTSTKLFFNPFTGVFNATDFNSLSDATLKTNFQPITNASDILKMISGIEFNWKDNNRKSAGVLAQEVQTILPHVVTESSSGLKSVNYGSLTAYLIQSVKELAARIEELEKKNGS